jgi:4-amino-4-deoxy-L-arabinose transferase-like glycosyltransferase
VSDKAVLRPVVCRWAPLVAVVALGATLRFWRLGSLALIGDESYYWLWSQRLDWAYFDHPAGVAVLTWLSTALGGQAEAGVRWLNALLGLACVPLIYVIGARMFSRPAGLLAATALAVGAPFLLTSRFVYTDALQLFLLLLSLYLFWRLALARPKPGLGTALGFGLSLALLLNTKYSAYLFAAGLLLAVAVDHRWLLAEPRAWLAAAVAGLGLLPVLLWNAAHGWASLRWQLSHAGFSLTGEYSLLGALHHSLAYLTWPLVLLALIGLGSLRRPAGRLLGLVALCMLLPVLLSPANSPRNLGNGLVALLVLAGARWPDSGKRPRRKWLVAFLALTLGAAAVLGVGTVADLSGPSPLPSSSAIDDIRRDAAGWRELGQELSSRSEPFYALDYSIASQIWYYAGHPAYTAWGQYRIWGIPEARAWTVISLDYLPPELVTERLRRSFGDVAGPERLQYRDQRANKVAYVWRCEGSLLDQTAFLQQFDFLTLLEAAR